MKEKFYRPRKKAGSDLADPVYPEGYTVELVLRTAFSELERIARKLEELTQKLTANAPQALLTEYDRLSNAYHVGGGYASRTRRSTRSATASASRRPCAGRSSRGSRAAKRRA